MPQISLLTVALLGLGLLCAAQADVESIGKGAGQDNYQTTIAPFLSKYCFDCHGAKEQKGKLRLDTLHGIGSRDLEVWKTVLERLEAGDMPPKKALRPSPEHLAPVTSWI